MEQTDEYAGIILYPLVPLPIPMLDRGDTSKTTCYK